jgi:hypothetical protein
MKLIILIIINFFIFQISKSQNSRSEKLVIRNDPRVLPSRFLRFLQLRDRDRDRYRDQLGSRSEFRRRNFRFQIFKEDCQTRKTKLTSSIRSNSPEFRTKTNKVRFLLLWYFYSKITVHKLRCSNSVFY